MSRLRSFSFASTCTRLDAVIVVDVLDLVGEDVGELIFAHHQVEHAFTDCRPAAGKRKSVDHVVIGETVKVYANADARGAPRYLRRGRRTSRGLLLQE